MNILDELERLEGDGLYDVDRDAVGSFGYLTERGELVEKALPALIRVARVANDFEVILRLKEQFPCNTLSEALQQLRDLGGTNEQD